MRARKEVIKNCTKCGLTIISNNDRPATCQDCYSKNWHSKKTVLFCPICKKTREVIVNKKQNSKNKRCLSCSRKYTANKYKMGVKL